MKNTIRSIAALAVAASSALLLSCSGGGLAGDDCDYLLTVNFDQTPSLVTGRRCLEDLTVNWEIAVELAADGGAGSLPDPGPRADFRLAFYDVTYINNSNGGSTPGLDVPPPIRISTESITEPGGQIALDNFPVLQAGQKLVAPLNDSAFYPVDGVPMTAVITWWGWPVTNEDKKCFWVTRWNFTVTDDGC